jgi:hypothetical protein
MKNGFSEERKKCVLLALSGKTTVDAGGAAVT